MKRKKKTLSKRNYPSPDGSLFSSTWSHIVILFSETLIDWFGIFEKCLFPLESCASGNCEWQESSLQTSCFRAFPALLGWAGRHFHPAVWCGSPSFLASGFAKGGLGKEAEKAEQAQTLERVRGGWVPAAPPRAAAWKASRACSGKYLYLLLVLPPRKYIGNAPLGSLDKHTLASSELHRA